MHFADRYGPWALVAGASEGLGAEFGRQLAARGLRVILVARRAAALRALAAEITAAHGVEARPLALDLARPDLGAAVAAATVGLEIGLYVHNAAFAPVGPFLDRSAEDHERVLAVNCRAPALLAHALGRAMRARGRGGIILMSSLAAFQGSALLAHYTATKAYNLVLAEGLWDELRPAGVDVLASCAGATRTPGYLTTVKAPSRVAPVMDPGPVVAETLAALGRQPSVIPGAGNKLAAAIMRRLFTRRRAIRIMSETARAMYELE
jgi:short-subunit dehydrogenase